MKSIKQQVLEEGIKKELIFKDDFGGCLIPTNIYDESVEPIIDLTIAKVCEEIDERKKLNQLRRKIFNEVPEHPDGIGTDILVAKEMLNFEDRFLEELKQKITGK